MNKLLPQFQNVTIWQSVMLATFSVLLTWVLATHTLIQYISESGSNLSRVVGFQKVAVTSFDTSVIIFGLGVYILAGLICLILLSFQKRLRAFPAVQSIWAALIFLGVLLAYILR